MPSHPPSSQPYNGPHGRLGRLPSPLFTFHTPPRDVQPEGGDMPSHDDLSHDKLESFPPEIGHPPETDSSTFIDLAGGLRLSVPPSCRWVGPEDLRVVGACPVDAGGFADIWVGEMNDRKVAVKSYRCYSSASCTPIHKVCRSQPFYALRSPTTNR